MNALRSSLLITLLLTTSAISTAITCKDGKCFASFVPKKASKVQKDSEEHPTIMVYKIEQDEEFVPFEEESTPNQIEDFHVTIIEEQSLPSNTISEPYDTMNESIQNIEEINSNEIENQMPTIEEELLLAETDIEYVCEEGMDVMCDIDTEMCICA
jgi:hypothetical protein